MHVIWYGSSRLKHLRDKGGPDCHWGGRQESKQETNLFTCARDFIQYTVGYEKTFLAYCDRKKQETMFAANKDNSRSSLYVLHNLLRVTPKVHKTIR